MDAVKVVAVLFMAALVLWSVFRLGMWERERKYKLEQEVKNRHTLYTLDTFEHHQASLKTALNQQAEAVAAAMEPEFQGPMQPPGTVVGWYCLGPSEIRVVIGKDGKSKDHQSVAQSSGFCRDDVHWPNSSEYFPRGTNVELVYQVGDLQLAAYPDGRKGWFSFPHFASHNPYGSLVKKQPDLCIELNRPLPPGCIPPRHGGYC